MPSPPSTDITQLLIEWGHGDQQALHQLTPLVYEELRRVARRRLRHERSSHTLQTTELVHEAYLKLVDQKNANWKNRSQFFGVAAQLMRRILVDQARHRKAAKRGPAYKISLSEAVDLPERKDTDLMALDDALNALAAIDPQQCRIVELRFFGGLSLEETADALQISPRTVQRDWAMAKAWIYREVAK